MQNPASGLLQIGNKSGKWEWHHQLLIWHYRQLFWRCHVSLSKFSNWSKFNVNIISGSRVMTIVVYKWLTRNLKFRNTPSDFCPTSGDWSNLGIPNLACMSQMKRYWMLKNAKVTAFTFFELLRENHQGRGYDVKKFCYYFHYMCSSFIMQMILWSCWV